MGQSTARPDLMSQLNIAVPSFNYNKQSGADGSDANDFASLRGLGFDQTLVLINGKRRHQSAFVNDAMEYLPALSTLWCVCASRLTESGPVWVFGP